MLSSLFKQSQPRTPQVVVAEPIAARPSIPNYKLERAPAHPLHEGYLAEYAEIAAVVGVTPPDLGIESFKALLAKLDFPIFSLHEVVAYMDSKAKKESKEQAGWEWRPLRAKDNDHMNGLAFGTRAERTRDQYGRDTTIIKPASDYYSGRQEHRWSDQMGAVHTSIGEPSSNPYDRTIPLHALRRVAMIEREHQGPISFLVSDYAPEPAITPYPDPFLMAVIPNLNVARGEGRFVIDFWDEPGFGIDKMLK